MYNKQPFYIFKQNKKWNQDIYQTGVRHVYTKTPANFHHAFNHTDKTWLFEHSDGNFSHFLQQCSQAWDAIQDPGQLITTPRVPTWFGLALSLKRKSWLTSTSGNTVWPWAELPSAWPHSWADRVKPFWVSSRAGSFQENGLELKWSFCCIKL